MRPLIAQHGVPRFTRKHVFTALVRAIVWQQLSGAVASIIWARVLRDALPHAVLYHRDDDDDGHGDGHGGDNAHVDASHFILCPHRVRAHASMPALRKAGLSQRKAEYIVETAAAFADRPDAYHFDDFGAAGKHAAESDAERIEQRLTALRGIGPWTAQIVMMFALCHANVLPSADLGVRKGYQKIFGLRTLPTPTEVERLARERLGGRYLSYSTWYMWKAANPHFVLPDE